jgi:hypothetical protein
LLNLKLLDVRSNKLKSLKGIESLTNLQKINFSQNFIEDWSVIEALPKLIEVTSYENRFLPETKPKNFDSFVRFFPSKESVCEFGRSEALRTKQITEEEFNTNKLLNFAPIFETTLDTESKILGWALCAGVYDGIR